MPVSLPWYGSEQGGFSFVGTVTMQSTADTYRADYSRGAMRVAANTGTAGVENYAQTPVFADAATVWLSARLYENNRYTSGVTLIEWCESGTAYLRLRALNSTTYQFQSRQSSVWTSIGSSFTGFTLNNLGRLETVVTIGTTGSVQVYYDGSSIYSGSSINTKGDNTAGVVNTIRLSCDGTTPASHFAYWSEVKIDTVSTLLMSGLVQREPTSDDTNTASSGTFAEVDEMTLNDTDAIVFNADGQEATFGYASISLGSATVGAVAISTRLARDASGPTHARGVCRIGGTPYYTSYQSLTTSLANYEFIFAENPATSSAWTESALNAAKFGVEANSV